MKETHRLPLLLLFGFEKILVTVSHSCFFIPSNLADTSMCSWNHFPLAEHTTGRHALVCLTDRNSHVIALGRECGQKWWFLLWRLTHEALPQQSRTLPLFLTCQPMQRFRALGLLKPQSRSDRVLDILHGRLLVECTHCPVTRARN